jgi:hypothetical protein
MSHQVELGAAEPDGFAVTVLALPGLLVRGATIDQTLARARARTAFVGTWQRPGVSSQNPRLAALHRFLESTPQTAQRVTGTRQPAAPRPPRMLGRSPLCACPPVPERTTIGASRTLTLLAVLVMGAAAAAMTVVVVVAVRRLALSAWPARAWPPPQPRYP